MGRRIAKAPIWACRSVGRSLPWHGRGPEFKSRHVHSFAFHQFRRSGLCSHNRLTFHRLGCWLGTSTKNDQNQVSWPYATTDLSTNISVVGSARPLLRLKACPRSGPCATKITDFIQFLCWLGTSTRNDEPQGWWPYATTDLSANISVVGSARPPPSMTRGPIRRLEGSNPHRCRRG